MSSTTSPIQNPCIVLLVDDDDDDIRFIKKTILSTHPQAKLLRASDGLEAMAMLRCQTPFEQTPRPSLVLLDLNMPKMNGFEVLEAMKSDSDLRNIPVVVLSTSDDEQDIAKCIALQADGYVTKPTHLREFREAVNAICSTWLNSPKA